MTAENSKLEIKAIAPIYGVNYDKGYIGFQGADDSLICRGITYVTRWEKMSDIATQHCFVVADEDTCVESVMTLNDANGVRRTPMTDYFRPDRSVFFRKPVGLTATIADLMVKIASDEVGKSYDFGAIIVQALSGSLAGRLLSNSQIEVLAKMLEDPNKWICSELCAHSLESAFNRDFFLASNNSLSPQELFESNIFQPWKH
ncbi:hypothetical protein QT972_09750 [Microcoleus sp. herbarium7]|uniref:hypothetical protein n=1 Tax=Microcoleus sp. herbarium7 TaxID=3055435 RepID=UPI002FCEE568